MSTDDNKDSCYAPAADGLGQVNLALHAGSMVSMAAGGGNYQMKLQYLGGMYYGCISIESGDYSVLKSETWSYNYATNDLTKNGQTCQRGDEQTGGMGPDCCYVPAHPSNGQGPGELCYHTDPEPRFYVNAYANGAFGGVAYYLYANTYENSNVATGLFTSTPGFLHSFTGECLSASPWILGNATVSDTVVHV